MAEVLKRSKKQVTADLEERSTSISNRIEAIESDLPVPSKKVRELVGKRSLIKIGVALAAGVVVSTLVFRFRRRPGSGFREELDDVSMSLGKEIRKNIKRGLETDDAVSRALRKRPPIVQIGGETGSLVSNLFAQVSRQIASAFGPVIAEKITEKIAQRFRSESDKK